MENNRSIPNLFLVLDLTFESSRRFIHFVNKAHCQYRVQNFSYISLEGKEYETEKHHYFGLDYPCRCLLTTEYPSSGGTGVFLETFHVQDYPIVRYTSHRLDSWVGSQNSHIKKTKIGSSRVVRFVRFLIIDLTGVELLIFIIRLLHY